MPTSQAASSALSRAAPSITTPAQPFFAAAAALWRLSIKPTTAPLGLGPQLVEWNGGLRWFAASISPSLAFETAQRAGGYATLFRGGDKRLGIQRLPANLLQAQRDYFGAHTYQRVDKPLDQKFHSEWLQLRKPPKA